MSEVLLRRVCSVIRELSPSSVAFKGAVHPNKSLVIISPSCQRRQRQMNANVAHVKQEKPTPANYKQWSLGDGDKHHLSSLYNVLSPRRSQSRVAGCQSGDELPPLSGAQLVIIQAHTCHMFCLNLTLMQRT